MASSSGKKKRRYPPLLYPPGKSPLLKRSVHHNCTLASFGYMKDCIGEDVYIDIWDHTQVGVLLSLADSDYVWWAKLVHYILTRQLAIERRYEIWSLIEGCLIRFSLNEYEDISGLNCQPIVEDDIVEVDHREFWAELKVDSGVGPNWTELDEALKNCRTWSPQKRKMLGLLFVVHVGILGLPRGSRIPLEYAKRVLDFAAFDRFPWGRVGFKELIQSIKVLSVKKESCAIHGCVHVLMIWAYECLKNLGKTYGNKKKLDEDLANADDLPPLLMWSGKRPRIDIAEFFAAEKLVNNKSWRLETKQTSQDEFPISCVVRNPISRTKLSLKKVRQVQSGGKEMNKAVGVGAKQLKEPRSTPENKRSETLIPLRNNYISAMHDRDPVNKRNDYGSPSGLIVPETQFSPVQGGGMEIKKVDRLRGKPVKERTSALQNKRTESVIPLAKNYISAMLDRESVKKRLDYGEERQVERGDPIPIDLTTGLEESSDGSDISEPPEVEARKNLGLSLEKLYMFCKDDGVVPREGRKRNLASTQLHPYVGSSVVKRILKGKKLSPAHYDPFEKHMCAIMQMLRKRSMREFSLYRSDRITFLDAWFVNQWQHDFKKFESEKNYMFPEMYFRVLNGLHPTFGQTLKKWVEEVDILYFPHNINNCHWVAVEVNLVKRRVKVYDNICSLYTDEEVFDSCKPYTKMIPALLKIVAPAEQKKDLSGKAFTIYRVKKTPQNYQQGDCGVYAVKYIECLAIGLTFDGLPDEALPALRLKLAAEVFHEVPDTDCFIEISDPNPRGSETGGVEFLSQP
ncbi:hypothetical protein CARUB_v10018755mg [Capsella rubella]|uniref:Ubiquitin-like protease family profile domain-containing protein n=1 Tax=Capsella rubella TaxID=81985 RepID=R0FRW6_9BRAS|nr:hypothetical protein CARUB_v10018755mg [Capsella rubella]